MYVSRDAGGSLVGFFPVSMGGVEIVCGKISSRCFPLETSSFYPVLPCSSCLLFMNSQRCCGGFSLIMRITTRCKCGLIVIKSGLARGRHGGVRRGVGERGCVYIKGVPGMRLGGLCGNTCTLLCLSSCRKFKVPVLRTRGTKYPIVTCGGSSVGRIVKSAVLLLSSLSVVGVTGYLGLLSSAFVQGRMVRGKFVGTRHFS